MPKLSRFARPGADLHRRAQPAGLEAHAATPGPLPDGERGPHLAREAPARAAPQPPEGGRGEWIWSGWAVFAYNVETYGRYA
jgi:hypothetical protein